MRPEAEASGYLGAETGNGKSKNKSNSNSQYGDLSTAHDMKPSCFGRDDRVWGWFEESGRALLDTPPFPPQRAKALAGGPGFAKCAKGRAPRVVVAWAKNGRVQVPIQRFFATLRMTTFVYAQTEILRYAQNDDFCLRSE